LFSPWKRLAEAIGLAAPRVGDNDPEIDRTSAEVLARVAHEARQPLSAARAAVAFIRQSPDNARRERACIVVDRQLVQLARLFDDLLDASRLRLGRTMLRVEPVDICRLVEEVVEAVRPRMIEKHLQLATHLPAEPVWLDGDPARLHQVMSNLLVNGINYTDLNGRVAIDLAHGPHAVVLTVSDTGCGIGADVLPHVFEPYIRAKDAPGEGLGIGLAIARQLVELHGGTIGAFSAGPGRGSEFVVTLPAQKSLSLLSLR
jgi:signal transduction histidine kinase